MAFLFTCFAQALQELYPGVKLTIGPAIENGFYYDVDLGENFISEKDLKNIEDRMLQIAREKHDFKIRSVSKTEAIKKYSKEKNQYKIELIENLIDEKITFAITQFTDLCRGGHIPNTGIIKAVKLLNIAGAYWRGDENNKQLTRIYGISFPKQKELKEYLDIVEEAKKEIIENWQTIGAVYIFKKVGQGLPLWLPNGAALRSRLENFLKKAQIKAGYEMVVTPHIDKKNCMLHLDIMKNMVKIVSSQLKHQK